MSTWILQHFLNPGLFWPGMALLAAPIIIHLINRMRYRRVRFAAMEFLLASQKQNRRRLLVEQLLLLLLRVAMILLIVALVARLITDPNQLSLFQGARSEHVVILDDSASMRDRVGEGSAFDVAKDAVRRIVAEGARRPGSQSLTLVLMSAPDQVVSGLSERVIDEPLLAEITERLETLDCTHQYSDPSKALEGAQRRLMEQRASLRQVHVLSDFRQSNWIDNKAAIALLQAMDKAKIGINLVRCVDGSHENLGISELGGSVEVAAARVPVSLSATVRNWGTREAQNVSASVFVDGNRLPRTVDFQTIPAGQSSTRRFDVIFETAQPHTVRLSLGDDALEADNNRFLAVDVPEDNPILIVDGSPSAEQANYIADALAADKSVTGFAPDIRTPEDLRRVALDKYHLIYLINISELPPDAVASLESYVRQGGGLIWYLGDAVRPSFYNEKLFAEEGGLFPVRLGPAPVEVLQSPDSGGGTGIAVSKDPLFELFNQSQVPILDQVLINVVYPLASDSPNQPRMADDVQVLARLSGEPLMFEHSYGAGKIFTCLTSAGPLINPEGKNWSNWANGPAGFSFVVLQLELAKRLIRKDLAFPQLPTGTPLEITFSPAAFQPEVEILTPLDQVTRLQAAPVPSEEGTAATAPQLEATFRETDAPGVYGVTLMGQDQTADRRLYALNVPAVEGALKVLDDPTLLRELGSDTNVRIQPAGSFDWIRSESPGSEIRWLLLVLLALVCMGEQFLSAKLSYQPGT
ncbi:BatA domain-containing protein [Planctomicrobium sp. SH661]|uniref:BatA domain-containing protein n=1 Tax=Planctomicrobium sp. SH661 TaxID=3448124 RepID=UPI003F5AEAD4